jgi:hypothetical protein
VGGIVGCHVNSQQGKPVDLAVNVRVATKQWIGRETSELHQGGATICDTFLWSEGIPGEQIHQGTCAQYGDNAVSHRVVYEWIEMFKNP